MICISKSFVRLLGVSNATIDNMPNGKGIFLSDLFSFGGGGNGGADVAQLVAEPEPRSLVLVGMADRYGVGMQHGAAMEEMCANDVTARLPTASEAESLIDMLSGIDAPMIVVGPLIEALESHAPCNTETPPQ